MTRFGEPRFIGIKKESIAGPASCVRNPTFFPVINAGEEICEICDGIDQREAMHSVGVDGDGMAYYVCDAAHPKEIT